MGSVLSKPVSVQRAILHDFIYTATCERQKDEITKHFYRFITAKITTWKTSKEQNNRSDAHLIRVK